MSTAISSATTMLMLRMSDSEYAFVQNWLSGSIWGANWQNVTLLTIGLALLLLAVFYKSRTLNVLAEGRLVNLAAGNGHPAEIMDMSFAVQALSLEWLARHKDTLEKKVYQVPDEIDDQIGRVKLAAMGLAIDQLTQEQKDYLAGWEA